MSLFSVLQSRIDDLRRYVRCDIRATQRRIASCGG